PAAVARIKREACPANARRLGLSTPCALTGRCTDCRSPQRMCNVTSILSRPTHGRSIEVWLIDEDLGY
ncbi:MAG: LUD domain-containing protein, partial [Eubacteriales bacterium]|nr:LUD domain-containing protein [Eubacteriales bacterium]